MNKLDYLYCPKCGEKAYSYHNDCYDMDKIYACTDSSCNYMSRNQLEFFDTEKYEEDCYFRKHGIDRRKRTQYCAFASKLL